MYNKFYNPNLNPCIFCEDKDFEPICPKCMNDLSIEIYHNHAFKITNIKNNESVIFKLHKLSDLSRYKHYNSEQLLKLFLDTYCNFIGNASYYKGLII